LSHILYGTPFDNTNGPKGVKYEDWTIAGVIEQAARENEQKAKEELARVRAAKAEAKANQAKL
jgi:phosphosulfolactate phosphohydrolase-like enzyme